MKSPIIILIVLILSTTSAYSAMNCKDVKKTSPKYLLCKAGSSVSSFKNKMSKKREAKNESGKKYKCIPISELSRLSFEYTLNNTLSIVIAVSNNESHPVPSLP